MKNVMPSSVIKYFSYDRATSSLTITFVTGKVYRYANVPQRVFRALTIAGSKGRYFTHYIRNNYSYEQLGET